MGRLRGFYASMVGKKVVIGVTGLIGIGFVILHSVGNLLVFRGPEAINRKRVPKRSASTPSRE